MKVNFIIPIMLSIILGFLCSKFIFNNYMEEKPVYNEIKRAYFLQYGVYKDENVLKDATKNLDSKLILTNNKLNYVYVSITMSEENALKIKSLFEKENINLFIKEIEISNNELIENIEQFDVLLKTSTTFKQVNSISKVILSTYEEIIIGNNL
ncbi:MAG: hypothetical protein RSF67_07675 [Clostridia bacterium]